MIKQTNKSQSSGFTLIEILIASIILFSSIAAVSLIYKGAYLSSLKANSHISISGILPVVLSNVRDAIRVKGNEESTELQGENNVWGVNYRWHAEQVSFKAPPEIYDFESGNVIGTPKKYKLWIVNLTLNYNMTNKNYQYNELSWNDK